MPSFFRVGPRSTLLLALVAGLSCSGLGARPTGVARLPVPIVSQSSSFSCGAAALMAALVYFGVFDGPESELHAPLGVTPEEGTRPERIVAVARAHGLAADLRTGLALADLESALARGDVVILDLQAWPEGAAPARWEDAWEDGHYVVVVGLDPQNLYVMDPSVHGAYGFIPRDELARRWHDYALEHGRRVEYRNLGIILRGTAHLPRFPGEPVRVE